MSQKQNIIFRQPNFEYLEDIQSNAKTVLKELVKNNF
jgi:hypothetical protein